MARISEPGAGAVQKGKQASGNPRPMVHAPDAADNNAKAIVKRYSAPAVKPNPDTRQASANAGFEQSHTQGKTTYPRRGTFMGVRPNPDQQRPGPGRRITTAFPGVRPNPDEQPGASVSSARRYIEASSAFKLPGRESKYARIPGLEPKPGQPGYVVSSPFSTAMYEATARGAMDNINNSLKSAGLGGAPWVHAISSRVDQSGNLRFYDRKGDEIIPGGDGPAYAHDRRTGLAFTYPTQAYNADGGGVAGPGLSVAEWGLRQAVRPLHAGFAAATELVKGHGVGEALKQGVRGLENKNDATGSTLLGALGAHGALKSVGGFGLDLAAGGLYPRVRVGSMAEDYVNAAQRAEETSGEAQGQLRAALNANDTEAATAASARSTAAEKEALGLHKRAGEVSHHKGVAVTVGGKVPFGPRLEHEFGMKTTSTINRVLTGNRQILRRKGPIGSTLKAFAPDYRPAEFNIPTWMKLRQIESQHRARLSEGFSSASRRLDAMGTDVNPEVVHAIEGGPRVPFDQYVVKQVPTEAYKAERAAVATVGKTKRQLKSLQKSEARLRGATEDSLVPLHNRAVIHKALRIAKQAAKQGSGPAATVLDDYRQALGHFIGASREKSAAAKAYRNAFGASARTGEQLYTKGGRERLPALPEKQTAAQERYDKAVETFDAAKAHLPYYEEQMRRFTEAEHGHVTRLKAAQQRAIGFSRHGNPGKVAPLEIDPSLEEHAPQIVRAINEQVSPELRRAVTRIVVRPAQSPDEAHTLGYFEPHSGEVHVIMHAGHELDRIGSMVDTVVHEAGHASSIPEVYDGAATPQGVYHLRHIARSLMDAFPAHESEAGATLHGWFTREGQIGLEHVYSRDEHTQAAEVLARLFQLHHEDPEKFLRTIGPYNAHFLNRLSTNVMGLEHAQARAGALSALRRQVKLNGSFSTDRSGVKFGDIERYDKQPAGRLARLERVLGKQQELEVRLPGLQAIARETRDKRLAADIGQKQYQWFVKEYGPLAEGVKGHTLVPHEQALASLSDELRHRISQLPVADQAKAHAMMDASGRMFSVEHDLGLIDKALPNYVHHTLSMREAKARESGAVRPGVAKGFGPAQHRFYGGELSIKEINHIRAQVARAAGLNLPDLLEVDPKTIAAARELTSVQATSQARFFADIKAALGRPWTPGTHVAEDEGVYKITPRTITHLPSEAKREEAHGTLGPHDDIVILPKVVYDKLIRSPHKVTEWGRGWDRMVATIKTGQTALNFPRHQLSNFFGDGLNAFVAGVSTGDATSTIRILKRIIHLDRQERAGHVYGTPQNPASFAEVNIAGKRWNVDDLIRHLRAYGISGTGYMAGELTSEATGAMAAARDAARLGDNPRLVKAFTQKGVLHPLRNVRRWDTWREEFWRIATGIGAKRRGWSWQQAKRHVDDWHFDYQDLTETEHNIRRFVPFYTFAARDTRAQARGLLLSPGKYAQIESGREEVAKAQGLNLATWERGLPEYLQQNVAVPVRASTLRSIPLIGDALAGNAKGKQPLAMTLTGIPTTDLNRLPLPFLNGSIQNAGLNALSSVVPPIRLTAELLINHSAFFKGPIYPDAKNPYVPSKAPAPTVIQWIAKLPLMADILGYTAKYHEPDGSIKPGYDPKIDYVLHGVFPQISTALAAGLPTATPRGYTFLQKLAGYSAINFTTPQSNALGAAKTAIGQLTVQKRELEGQGKAGGKEWLQTYEALRLAERQYRVLTAKTKAKGSKGTSTSGLAPPPPPPPAPPPPPPPAP